MQAKGYYRHPYGGTAWDIKVKPGRFASLFGIPTYRLATLPTWEKVANLVVRDNDGRLVEILGYVNVGPRGGRHYITTYVRH